MGGEQSTDRSLSDYQNSERIGIFRQLEEQGRNTKNQKGKNGIKK